MQKDTLQRRLKSLAADPVEQSEFAAQLLNSSNGIEVIRAALDVLIQHPVPSARNSLRELYWHFAENKGVRDPAAYTRNRILQALREVMGWDDTELVLHAVRTYEFTPPSFREEAGLLRGTALVLLAELDVESTSFFAAKLLADGYTESMSGQPALTAVQVLAAMNNLIPLYHYVCQPDRKHPEVISECLRNLADAPDAVVDDLVDQFGDSDEDAALAGLFELLLSGSSAPRHPEYLCNFLHHTRNLDLYRFLVTVMATSSVAAVRALLADATKHEERVSKREIVEEVLLVSPPFPELQVLRNKLQQ